MHASLSVIAFTVLSGAGLGGLACVALADLGSAWGAFAPVAPRSALALAAAVSLALVVAGLLSSTLHLANPRNAWRAASRFRTSWLSREAVFALALLPAATAYAAMLALGARTAWPLAAAVVLLAWCVLLCTAMIYASLKPIRQWHTMRVPVAYFVLGHASGAVVVEAVLRSAGGGTPGISAAGIVLSLAAWLVKEEYWHYAASDRDAVTLASAIGVHRGVGPPGVRGASSVMAARLLDAGNSGGTFLTREFVNPDPGRRRYGARVAFLLGTVALPVLWLGTGAAGPWLAGFVAATCLAGLLAERWLFFADARHTVRLYHGDRRT